MKGKQVSGCRTTRRRQTDAKRCDACVPDVNVSSRMRRRLSSGATRHDGATRRRSTIQDEVKESLGTRHATPWWQIDAKRRDVGSRSQSWDRSPRCHTPRWRQQNANTRFDIKRRHLSRLHMRRRWSVDAERRQVVNIQYLFFTD